MKTYVDIAKKIPKNNTNSNFKNNPGQRGSDYVQNEFEEVVIQNNLKNIQRISTTKIKLPSKENNNYFNNIRSSPNMLNFNFNKLNREDSMDITYSEKEFSKKNTINNDSISSASQNISRTTENGNLRKYQLTNPQFVENNFGKKADHMQKFVNMSENNNHNFLTPIIKKNNINIVSPNQNNSLNISNNLIPQSNRSNHSFDQFKPPVKRGMFSYPKSSQMVSQYLKQPVSPRPQSNIPSNNVSDNNINQNNLNRYLLVSSNANLNTENNSSTLLSVPRNFSLEKYQINKNSNQNLINKNITQVDESESLILKKNESSSSLFNKYKVGLNTMNKSTIQLNDNYSNSTLLDKTSNESSTNINNLLKGNMNVSNNHNENDQQIGSVIGNQTNIGNNGYNRDKFHSFSLPPNYVNTPQPSSSNNLPLQNKNSFQVVLKKGTAHKMGSVFKTKSKHEKASRRMIIELLKLKLKKKSQSKTNEVDLSRILDELKIDPIVLDRQYIENNNSSVAENSSIYSRNSFQTAPKMSNSNDVYYPVTGSLEIRNNNFEINNNYYSSYNILKGVSTDNINAGKSVTQFIYNMDEDSQEKLNLVCFLMTPRIMYMNIGSINTNPSQYHQVPFIFQLSPSNVTHSLGIEHYLLQWNDINTMAPVGQIDLLKITSCSIKQTHSKEANIIILETTRDKNSTPGHSHMDLQLDNNRYEIIANSPDECRLFVNSLNYLTQLVKCKAYAVKGKNK